ncbi:MAG: preprotein translocase subunit SecG [Bacteroidia bacterium]
MFLFIAIIIIISCILLTFIVLIQNPKGGGIAANFIAPQQIMGAKRSTDVVEKATWILAVILISCSLLSNFFRPTGEGESTVQDSRIKENLEQAPNPQAPQQPQPQQQQQQGQPGAQQQQK